MDSEVEKMMLKRRRSSSDPGTRHSTPNISRACLRLRRASEASDKPKSSPKKFKDLPFEVRAMIYREALDMPLFINLRIFAGCDEHLTKKHGILEADKSMLDAMRRFSVLRAVSKEVNKLFARLPHTMQTYKGTIRFHASKDLFMLRYLDHLSYWSMSDKKLQALQSILPSGMVDVGIYLEFNAAWLPKRESDLTMLPLIAPALLSVKRIFLAMPHCLGKHKGDGYLLKAEEDVSSETGETTPQRHYVWQPGPADNAPDGMMYRIRALEKIMNEALQRLAGCKNAQHSSLEVQKWIQRLEFVGLMHHDYGGSRVGTRYVMD